MIDKIKVNLSYYVYNTILEDMVWFEFIKPNGDVNRNEFLNVIINNFYYSKLKKREEFINHLEKEAILIGTSNKNKEKMFEAASRIMDDFYNEDIKYKYHVNYFMIYPTKRTQSFLITYTLTRLKQHFHFFFYKKTFK